LTFVPKEGAIEECEACSKAACDFIRLDCLEDEECAPQLKCLSQCGDPGCWEECRVEHAHNRWTTWGFTNILEVLQLCTLSSCTNECKPGDNWTCVGDYDLPNEQTRAELDIYARFGTGALPYGLFGGPGVTDTLAGATAEACRGGLDDGRYCDELDQAVRLDASNGADLTLVTNHQGVVDGYLELVPERRTVITLPNRIYSPLFSAGGTMQPFYYPAEILVGLSWSSAWTGEVAAMSAEIAGLVVMKTDCNRLGSQSAGRIVVRKQWQDEVLAEAREFATEAVAIFPLNLAEEQMVTVEFTLADEKQPAAARDVLLTPGWVTHVALEPRAF
jgi:hypothetical protein